MKIVITKTGEVYLIYLRNSRMAQVLIDGYPYAELTQESEVKARVDALRQALGIAKDCVAWVGEDGEL